MRDVKLKNKKIKKFAYESYVYIGNNLFLTGLDFFFFFWEKDEWNYIKEDKSCNNRGARSAGTWPLLIAGIEQNWAWRANVWATTLPLRLTWEKK